MDDLIADFIAETSEGLEALDSQLVLFERQPDNPELLGGVFRLIHTIKGASGFLGLTRLQTVAHAAENLLGAFRDGELDVTPQAVSVILETVDVIRGIIAALGAEGAEPVGDDKPLVARLEAVLQGSDPAGVASRAPDCSSDRPLIERLGGDATLDSAAEMVIPALAAGPFAAIDRDVLHALLRDGLIAAARCERPAPLKIEPAAQTSLALGLLAEALQSLDVEPAAIAELMRRAAPSVATPREAAPAAAAIASVAALATDVRHPPQTIRVSVDALEHLMTVVSELVLIRNQLIQTLRLDPESPFAAPLNRLNQVTSELQEGVMTTRMQPISGAWAGLPRLVRDLSHDLGKTIDLVMEGQETELDRQVLEMIKDPLTHMIRNAADHGLESPAERLALGKPQTGRITLAARHEGGAILIEVADDGRGLDAAKIRAKAATQGLISAAQAETMSDTEVRKLIFSAGFSTAAQVTAVSGRGVGMDVVRANIEQIGGSIDLASVEGQGSRFTIRIPLTLTIVSALIVECCGERFAMPQSAVIELVSANGRAIEEIDGAQVLRLRDRLLPLVALKTLLGLEGEVEGDSEACIVVAQVGAFAFGVIVDKVFDTEEIVVKPVATVLRHLKMYSGVTILGDGSVILILDFKGISLEAGAEHAAGAGDLREPQGAGPGAASVSLEPEAILLFRAANDALKATPLADVARIEEIAAAQLERVDGNTVIQYRGRLMPIIAASGARPDAWEGEGLRPLLVFAREGQSVGLLVDEIVDIVESALQVDLQGGGAGSRGSLIIGEKATELIDVAHIWRTALQQSGPVSAAPPASEAPAATQKRLLVIDQSPFTKLLLGPMLGQVGYAVEVAADAAAALEHHARGEVYDLILADTAAHGRALAEALKDAVAWRATPLFGIGREAFGDRPADAQASLLVEAARGILEGEAA